jgi:demethylmenaquinone methyltransferase/2-methoxy-6-polyprenyl-1,4-benzoquinol methylase
MHVGDLIEYYSQRAAEYDKVYAKPERQEDLAELHRLLRRLLAGHDVLEIACGTGYWTASIAPVARSVLATDASADMLERARARRYPEGRVRFAVARVEELDSIPGTFTASLAGFWWSHVAKQEIGDFLSAFHRRLGTGARVVFIDNRYVEGSSTPIAHWDEAGNSYQDRALDDGQRFGVLKNFPSDVELRSVLDGWTADLEIALLTYYWCASYRVAVGSVEMDTQDVGERGIQEDM